MGEQGEEGNARPSVAEKGFRAKSSAGHQPESFVVCSVTWRPGPLQNLSLLLMLLLLLFVYAHATMCVEVRDEFVGLVFPFYFMWVPGTEVRASGLCQGKLCLLTEPSP